MRYYLSARAEALKESIGKVTAEPTPAQTTGAAQTTSSAATAVTTGSTEVADATMPNAAVPGGCGGADIGSPLLMGGGAIAVAVSAIAGTRFAKKKKDE
jgi:hypothetical protein